MTKTLIDIDDNALAAAAQVLGTTTKVATVNRALAEVSIRRVRLAFLDDLYADEDDLSDPEVMKTAWH